MISTWTPQQSNSGLSFDFTGGALDPRITFSRGSVGSYFGSDGLLKSASVDTPRFAYNPSTLAARGLLIEPAATNALSWSEAFDNAAWTKVNATIGADATIAPSGSATADKFIKSATTSHAYVDSSYTGTGNISWSAFLKAGEFGYAKIHAENSAFSGLREATINLSTGAIVTNSGAGTGVALNSVTVTPINNGWYRVTLSVNVTSGTGLSVRIYACTSAGANNILGDGVSGFYMSGGQVESGAASTSPILTTSGPATRSADNASFTIPTGIGHLTYTFDDDTTQVVAVSPGAYSIPTNLNRAYIKSILGAA